MTRWFLLIGVMLGLSIGSAVGQERDKSRDETVRDIEMRERLLQLQKHESEINFENEMRKFQLDMKRIELEHAKRMGPQPPGPMGPGAWMTGQPMCQQGHCPAMPLFVLACIAVNILLAVWVNQDIRKRNAGSRLWIAIVLLAGFFGALLYALVRIGDRP